MPANWGGQYTLYSITDAQGKGERGRERERERERERGMFYNVTCFLSLLGLSYQCMVATALDWSLRPDVGT
jgi:hypothetical protein